MKYARPPQIPRVTFDRLFTIEGIMMLMTAALIDIFGLIEALPVLGSILSYLVDIVGILLIGGWIMFFQHGKTPLAAGGRGGKLAKWFIRIVCGAGELTPLFGALPLWTILVFFELIIE